MVTVETVVIFKTYLFYISSKFILHEESPKKESQWYSQEAVTQNFKWHTYFYVGTFCKH